MIRLLFFLVLPCFAFGQQEFRGVVPLAIADSFIYFIAPDTGRVCWTSEYSHTLYKLNYLTKSSMLVDCMDMSYRWRRYQLQFQNKYWLRLQSGVMEINPNRYTRLDSMVPDPISTIWGVDSLYDSVAVYDKYFGRVMLSKDYRYCAICRLDSNVLVAIKKDQAIILILNDESYTTTVISDPDSSLMYAFVCKSNDGNIFLLSANEYSNKLNLFYLCGENVLKKTLSLEPKFSRGFMYWFYDYATDYFAISQNGEYLIPPCESVTQLYKLSDIISCE